MDKFLDKIGFYEIISSLVAGLLEVFVSCFVIYFSFYSELSVHSIQKLFSHSFRMEQSIPWIMVFLLFSFSIEMIFNEIGDLFKWILRKYNGFFIRTRNRIKGNLFQKRKAPGIDLTRGIPNALNSHERDLAFQIIQKTLAEKNYSAIPENEQTIPYLFQYANTYLSLKGKNQFVRKMQILASLFRGLIVFSLVLLIGSNLLVWIMHPPYALVGCTFNVLLSFLTFCLFPMIENKYRMLLLNFSIRHFVIESINN